MSFPKKTSGAFPFKSFGDRVSRSEFLRLAEDPRYFSKMVSKDIFNQDLPWERDSNYHKKLEIFYDTVVGTESVYRLAAEQALIAFWVLYNSEPGLNPEAFAEKVRLELAEVKKGIVLPGGAFPVHPVTPEERSYGMLQRQMNQQESTSETTEDEAEFSKNSNQINFPSPSAPLAAAGLMLLQAGIDSTVPLQIKIRLEENSTPAKTKSENADTSPEIPSQLSGHRKPENAPVDWKKSFTPEEYKKLEKGIQKLVDPLRPELPSSPVVASQLPTIGQKKKFGTIYKVGGLIGAIVGGVAYASTTSASLF